MLKQTCLFQLGVCLRIFDSMKSRVDESNLTSTVSLSESEQLLYCECFYQENCVPSIAKDVFEKVEGLMKELSALSESWPVLRLSDLDINTLRDELSMLKNGNIVAEALINLQRHVGFVDELIMNLMKLDSVYLHQIGRFIQQLVDEQLDDIFYPKDLSETEATRSRPDEKASAYIKSLKKIETFCYITEVIQRHQMSEVVFNNSGEVKLNSAFKKFYTRRKAEVKNSLKFPTDGPRTHILTGPNGSGKTEFEKTSIQTILFANAVGYTTAQYATLPIFDAVIYLDRVVGRVNSHNSAFTQELEYWKKILELLEGKRSAFICVDEAFSTTSPLYQAAFTYGVIAHLAQSQHYLQLSTHNHSVVEFIQKVPFLLAYASHFLFSIEQEKVVYHHILHEGHEQSYAIDVAEMMGLPTEIVTKARTW